MRPAPIACKAVLSKAKCENVTMILYPCGRSMGSAELGAGKSPVPAFDMLVWIHTFRIPMSAVGVAGVKPCGGCWVVITHAAMSTTCIVPGKGEG